MRRLDEQALVAALNETVRRLAASRGMLSQKKKSQQQPWRLMQPGWLRVR